MLRDSIDRSDLDKEFAAWVSTGAMIWYMRIHDTTDWARGTLSHEQHRLYCRAAARVLGFTMGDLLEPIYKGYPELAPEVLRWGENANDAGRPTQTVDIAAAVVMSVSEFKRGVLELADVVELNLRDVISLARLRCSRGALKSLEAHVGDILEQVNNWRGFVLTMFHDADQ
jgi:hypothetical protein